MTMRVWWNSSSRQPQDICRPPPPPPYRQRLTGSSRQHLAIIPPPTADSHLIWDWIFSHQTVLLSTLLSHIYNQPLNRLMTLFVRLILFSDDVLCVCLCACLHEVHRERVCWLSRLQMRQVCCYSVEPCIQLNVFHVFYYVILFCMWSLLISAAEQLVYSCKLSLRVSWRHDIWWSGWIKKCYFSVHIAQGHLRVISSLSY